jgi:hypothetical protein
MLFDNYPFIFHMNGSYLKNTQGRRLRTAVFDFMGSNKYEGKGGIRDTTYFICSSYGEREVSLEKTLKFFKVPYVMKGRGTKNWRNTMKAGLLADYLPEINTKYTMGIDSHDVCLVKEANGIIDVFESDFDCDMLFNGELVSYPKNNQLAKFEENCYQKESPFCYLNSGVWIAKTKFLKEVINDILVLKSSRPRSDQEIYRKLHHKYYPQIQVDSKCKLFQTTCNSHRAAMLQSHWYNKNNAYEIEINKTDDRNFELKLIKE